ncbi:aminopeptidase N isoform X2 [Drosophila bipectinata]
MDFNGMVLMYLKWITDSKKIYFHSHTDLYIDDKKIKLRMSHNKKNLSLKNIPVLRCIRLPKKTIYVVHLKEVVGKGSEGIIEIPFKGKILKTAQGVFVGFYKNSSSLAQESFLATNLKPNNARRLLPCFDEPEIKVPFKVSIARPEEYVAVFNTMLNETLQHPMLKGYRLDAFNTTLPIPAYSLCFIISKLQTPNEIILPDDPTIQSIRIWNNNITNAFLKNVQSRLTIILKSINDVFDVPLPSSKIDVFIIPELPTIPYISSWGILIGRESEFANNGFFQISKEIIHHWIGIWLTPSWWSIEPLNKALISFLATEIVINIDGGIEFNGKYPMTILYSLYYELSKRYPYSRITGMKQESNSFKIELIIRMIKYTIGKSSFKQGIRNFICDYKYKTYNERDFWNALSKQSKIDDTMKGNLSIIDIADSWVQKGRLPLITITRDYKAGTAIINQKVYLRERPHDVPKQDEMAWLIPIPYMRQDSMQNTSNYSYFWLKGEKQISISNMPDKNNFIIANPEEIGPFPVNYDDKNWNMILNFLKTTNGSETIPAYTRAKLLHDAWNLAYAGELHFSAALNMTLFLKNERDHIVWSPVFTFLDQIGRRIDIPSVVEKFELYTIDLLAPLYEDLIKENKNDDFTNENFRKLTKSFLCRAGYLQCIQEAHRAFAMWINISNLSIPNSLPKDYICPVFKWGSMNEWILGLERIMLFTKSHIQSDRTFLLKMLAGCPSQTEKIHYLLEVTMIRNISYIKESDLFLIFNMLGTETIGYSTLLNFIVENWDIVYQKFYHNSNLWDRLIGSATGRISTQNGYDKVKSLYENHKGQLGSAKHIIERSLRIIREEINWSQKNMPVIENWLDIFLSNRK